MQLGQIDIYKEQNSNLKKQIQVCEGKIKFYDAENARRQSQLEELAIEANSKQSNMLKEIEQKDSFILDLQKQNEDYSKKISEDSGALEEKQKEIEQLTEDMEKMNKKIQDIEGENEVKELSHIDQENSLKKQVFNGLNNKKIGR